MSQRLPPKKRFLRLRDWFMDAMEHADQKLAIQLFILVVAIALGVNFASALSEYETQYTEVSALIEKGKYKEFDLPSKIPAITKAIGTLIVLVAFGVSFFLRRNLAEEGRIRLTKMLFWTASFGVMIAWLPGDFAVTYQSLTGKAIYGELPTPWAYAGKLILIAFLIASFPIAVEIHYRSSIMDQYVMRNFLTPFSFCLIGFIAIWIIADLIDNVTDLAGADVETVLSFYFVQIPFMVVFVLPAALLLSLLFSLSKMSTANELISMIGSGRSVLRILRPLFFAGIMTSMVALAFKYEWAPSSIGYKESLLELVKNNRKDKKKSKKETKEAQRYAKSGWMHVNEIDNRTWFVGRVPRDVRQDNMAGVVIWQMSDDGQPRVIWYARSAQWMKTMDPPEWWLRDGKTYTYVNGVPRVQSFEKLRLPGFRETPWKVINSSQNAEHLGLPGLALHLKSNAAYDDSDLAPFRTNMQDTFAEPLWCLVMVLVAAPLGIVYSRRGVLAGVAGSIVIFALMYVFRGTLLALGQGNYIPAWLAAWGTNMVFAIVGVILLWFRAQNREIPKLKTLIMKPFVSGKKGKHAREKTGHTAAIPETVLSPLGLSTSGGLDGVLDPEALRALDETLSKIPAGEESGKK